VLATAVMYQATAERLASHENVTLRAAIVRNPNVLTGPGLGSGGRSGRPSDWWNSAATLTKVSS
jgi:hypothetical protein